MRAEIKLELGELLSRKACAVVIKNIIKFIAYNNQQIPYTYEGFQRLVTKKKSYVLKENEGKIKPLTFKEIKANQFYEKIEGLYDAFETTFNCIEEEIVQGSTIREIVIILGSTLVSPKHVYRIQIPKLSSQDDGDTKIRSHLFKIYRSIITSNNYNSSKCTGLTNIFILVNGECSSESDWFIPKFDFRIPPKASQTLITFADTNPCNRSGTHGFNDLCPHIGNTGDELLRIQKNPEVPTVDSWFLAKQALSGFQDLKIDGVSVYNVLFGFER